MRISKEILFDRTVTLCVFLGFIVCGIVNEHLPILRYLTVIIVLYSHFYFYLRQCINTHFFLNKL